MASVVLFNRSNDAWKAAPVAIVHTMSATEARVHFGWLLRRVAECGETVIVEHRGKPKVVFVSIPEYERLTGRSLAEAMAHDDAADSPRP